jgi:DNA-binding response OmpR family regulator
MTANDLLLVGCEPRQIERIRRELARLDGFEVFEVETAEVAAQLVTPEGPALVVVALDSSDEPGAFGELVETCTVAEHARPVVFVSDIYDEETARALFEFGATDYLSECDHLDQIAPIAATLTGALELGEPPSRPKSAARLFPMRVLEFQGAAPIA